MRSTGVVRSHNSPFRIVPQRGKVAEYFVKPPRSEHWAVLHEREPGLYLANDPGHFGPQSASLSVKPVSLSGNADILTGKPSADDINVSAPWLPVERAHVIPHREGREHSVPLPCEQHASRVGSKLNSADGAPSKQVSAQDASSCPCKKCQLIHSVLFVHAAFLLLARTYQSSRYFISPRDFRQREYVVGLHPN